MRLLVVLLLVGSALMAQRGGGGARVAARPSMPSAPAMNRPAPAPPRMTSPPPATHPSTPRPVYNNLYNNRNTSRTVIAPYPVFVYGGYYAPYAYPNFGNSGYDATAAPAPAASYGYVSNSGSDSNYAYDPNSAPQSAPTLIINRNFRPDSNYSGPVLDPDQDQPSNGGAGAPPVVFLIAMKDHTIFPAVAYWVEGDTLNYITTQGVHNRASLDLVDRDFSEQLNHERRIDFALPPSPK